MKEEKNEKGGKKDKAIIILDKGIRATDDPTPGFVCCGATFFPLRW